MACVNGQREHLLRKAFFHGSFVEYITAEDFRNIHKIIQINLSSQTPVISSNTIASVTVCRLQKIK